MRFHQEQLPSAIERYQKEVLRVFGVLESVLSKRRWLVGDKCSVADLSFSTYVSIHLHRSSPMLLPSQCAVVLYSALWC